MNGSSDRHRRLREICSANGYVEGTHCPDVVRRPDRQGVVHAEGRDGRIQVDGRGPVRLSGRGVLQRDLRRAVPAIGDRTRSWTVRGDHHLDDDGRSAQVGHAVADDRLDELDGKRGGNYLDDDVIACFRPGPIDVLRGRVDPLGAQGIDHRIRQRPFAVDDSARLVFDWDDVALPVERDLDRPDTIRREVPSLYSPAGDEEGDAGENGRVGTGAVNYGVDWGSSGSGASFVMINPWGSATSAPLAAPPGPF